MKLKGTFKPHTVYTVEVTDFELDWIERGIKKLLERYPNSDPLIDILFDLKRIRGSNAA